MVFHFLSFLERKLHTSAEASAMAQIGHSPAARKLEEDLTRVLMAQSALSLIQKHSKKLSFLLRRPQDTVLVLCIALKTMPRHR